MLNERAHLFVIASVVALAVPAIGAASPEADVVEGVESAPGANEGVDAICIFRPNALFVLDRDGDRCAYIVTDIADWSTIGLLHAGDEFRNDSTTRNVMVFSDPGFSGAALILPRGSTLFTRNFGGSNRWLAGPL